MGSQQQWILYFYTSTFLDSVFPLLPLTSSIHSFIHQFQCVPPMDQVLLSCKECKSVTMKYILPLSKQHSSMEDEMISN